MMDVLAILVGISCISGGIAYLSYKFQEKEWNDGKCSKCGKEWKLDRCEEYGRTYYCENDHCCVMSTYNEK